MIELVVTDLDGTLWTRGEDIHPAARAAWSELEARGIPVIVATGRRLTSTREPLARAGLTHAARAIGTAAEVHLSADSLWGGDTLTIAPAGLSK